MANEGKAVIILVIVVIAMYSGVFYWGYRVGKKAALDELMRKPFSPAPLKEKRACA